MKRILPLLVIVAVLTTACVGLAVERAKPKPAPRQGDQIKPNWWGPPPPNDGPRPDPGPKANGIVVAVGADSVTLRTPCGFNTYIVGPNTEIIVGGNPGALADIAVGFRANVNFEFNFQNLTTHARRLAAFRPEPAGRITSINGNLIVITDETDTAWNVTITPETRIKWLRLPLTPGDLRVGYHARAEGQIDGHNVRARAIQLKLPFFKGAVTEVNNNSIKVKTVEQRVIEGVLSDRTVVVIKPRVGPDQPGTRADIKRGMPVNIGGHVNEGRPMDVLLVELLIGE